MRSFIVTILFLLFSFASSTLDGIHKFSTNPIVNVGFAKSGTTTLDHFLKTIFPGIRTVHWTGGCYKYHASEVKLENVSWPEIKVSDNNCSPYSAIQMAVAENRPPFHYFLHQQLVAYTQLEMVGHACAFVPQIDLLERILDAYPTAYYVHTVRDVSKHVRSIMHWNDLADRIIGSGLAYRFTPSNETGLVHNGSVCVTHPYNTKMSEETKYAVIENFLTHMRHHVREMFRRRPHLKYLEFYEEFSESGEQLSVFLGAPAIMHLNVVANVGAYNHTMSFK